MVYYTSHTTKIKNSKMALRPIRINREVCCVIVPYLLPNNNDDSYVKSVVNRLIWFINVNADIKDCRSEIIVLLTEERFKKYVNYINYTLLLYCLVNYQFLTITDNLPNVIKALIKDGLLSLEDVIDSIGETIDNLHKVSDNKELFNKNLNSLIMGMFTELDNVGTGLANVSKATMIVNKQYNAVEFSIYPDEVIFDQMFSEKLKKLFVFTLHGLVEIISKHCDIINDSENDNIDIFYKSLSHLIDVSFNRPIVRYS